MLSGRTIARDTVTNVAAVAVALGAAALFAADSRVLATRLALGITASLVAALAGSAALMRHRLTGDGPLAYLGLGLLTYGLTVVPSAVIASQLPAAAAGLMAMRAAAAVGVLLLLAAGLTAPVVDTRIALRRLAAFVAGGIVAIAAPLEIATRHWGSSVPVLANRLLILLWLAVACGYLAGGLRTRRTALWRSGIGLALLALANGVGMFDPTPASAVAMSLSGVRLIGVAALLLGLVPDLLAALSARRRDEASIRGWWTQAEADNQAVRREVAERRHEICNALVGIAGAAYALDPDRRLVNRQDAALLRRGVQQEVERLQRLVGDEGARPDRVFNVDDVLRPIVAARRTLGENVNLARDPELEAYGSPEAVSQIVVNLLTNCARHAPGARVDVTTWRESGRVLVSVVDDGPSDVAPAGPGSGLGLAVSARLAEEHGGRLQLRPSTLEEAGFAVVVELPASPRRPDSGLAVPNMRQDWTSQATAGGHSQAS